VGEPEPEIEPGPVGIRVPHAADRVEDAVEQDAIAARVVMEVLEVREVRHRD
jgi:hypothetical protein